MDIPESWRSYATICRLCLQKDGFMLGIFNHIQGRDKSIYKKIMDCTALQISFGDGLPNVICHRCLYKIEFCLEFRQLCFVSDATLRTITGTANKENGSDSNQLSQLPLLEQLANGNEEDVVMVVDPTALDYDSEYETDNEKQSDNENAETNDTFECRNVSMCKFCDHAFTDKASCVGHESTAHNHEVPYSCNSCNMGFADRLQYSAHLKSVHQNDKPYNCPQCDRTFARRSDLRKHTIVHTGVKPYTCSVCFKSFSRNTNLSKHMRIHSGHKPFVCQKCPKTFISKGDLTRHAIIHSGKKPFACSFCNLSFGRRDKLVRHERRHLPRGKAKDRSEELQVLRENLSMAEYKYEPTENTNGYDQNDEEKWNSSENMVINLDPFSHNNFGNCDATPQRENNSECEAPSNETDLPRVPDHIKDEALTEQDLPYVPEHITGDCISNNTNLQDENAEEEDNKKFTCSTCNKKFSTPENLKYHQACHSGIRPFSCHVCNKSFIRKRELDRHVATHTGMKPFKCTRCPKSFGRKDKLVRHARIHDTKREYNCKICGTTFNRRDSLIQHLKNHNKEEQE